MKLYQFKNIAKLFIEEKKNPEEDSECMTSGSVLAPSASTNGGNITNSDSYAPGDNRLPKPLFKKPLKRKSIEEDSEELLKGNFLFRAMSEKEFVQMLQSGLLMCKDMKDDIDEIRDMAKEIRSHSFKFKNLKLTINHLKSAIKVGYKYYLSFFRTTSFYSNMERYQGNSSLIVFFDKDALKSLPNSRIVPFTIFGERNLKIHDQNEAEDRLYSKVTQFRINIKKFIKGVYFSNQFYNKNMIKAACQYYGIPLFGDYKEQKREYGIKEPTVLSNIAPYVEPEPIKKKTRAKRN